MCILIHHPANVSFSDELLNDFYAHNSDGFGAMYSEGGKLVIVNRKARKGRNPATGETIQIPAKRVLKFRVAKAAKDTISLK